MQKSLRSRAEEQFAATQKKAKQALNEKEKARREIDARMAKPSAWLRRRPTRKPPSRPTPRRRRPITTSRRICPGFIDSNLANRQTRDETRY